MPWYKGNIHTHTDNSDGEGTLQQVADAYAALEYDFLFITDHNGITQLDDVRSGVRLFPGCEVTLGAERVPVHVNALNVREITIPRNTGDIVQTLTAAVDAINAAGGIAQFNHPNFHWALRPEHMLRVTGWHLLEIFNAHFECNNYGGDGLPSPEQMWDELLSRGMKVWGSASDDMHHVTCEPISDYPKRAMPGKAWVVVNSGRLDVVADAIRQGDFYSSTGVMLDEISVHHGQLNLTLTQFDNHRYTTQFITDGGKVVKSVGGLQPSCDLSAATTYLRAKVMSSNGWVAWTQPVWPKELA